MNIGTASYGTGAFRAMGSLSESAIFDFYGAENLQPEKRLMFAILLDAVECFQEYAEQDRLFKDAEEWIFEDDHEWSFSFINICEGVDMDPKYLRKGLLHWRQSAIPIPKANTLWPAIVLNKGRINGVLKHLFNSPAKGRRRLPRKI